MLFQTKRQRALKELVKRVKLQEYQLTPSKWLTERFGEPLESFKWSEYPEYKNHVWDGTPDPFYAAIDALVNGIDVGIEAATGVGKTYLASKIAYWFLDVFTDSAVITTSPTREQLLQVLWKEIGYDFAKFKRLRPLAQMVTGDIRISRDIDYGKDSSQVVYSNRMTAKVGRRRAGEDSSISFQGIHNKYQLFILDEAAGLEESVIKAIKNTNTDKSPGSLNLILALGNPDSMLDALHQFCEQETTKHIIVSAYDHPNIVANANISGAVSADSIKMRADEYGEESFFFKSRVRGQAPTESTDSLIKLEWVKKCTAWDETFYGKGTELNDLKDKKSRNALGVDVANSIDGDKAALCWGEKNICQEMQEFQCPNASHLAYNILWDNLDIRRKQYQVFNTPKVKDYKIRAENVGVDTVGVGASTINTLHNMKFKAIGLVGGQLDSVIPTDKEGKPMYKFGSLRSHMYYQAAIDLRDSNVILNIPKKLWKQLAKELTIIKYSIKSGKINVEPKDEIKKRLGGKSPNLADCFVYWNWMRHNYYTGTKHLPFS